MKGLVWESRGKHHIYGTDGWMVSVVDGLEHTTGQACFDVHQDYDGWTCTFWHGNKGHCVVSGTQSRDDAIERAQEHINKLAKSLCKYSTETTEDAA